MIKVGVLGASGYAGAELTRLLLQRDDVELKFLGASSKEGQAFTDFYTNLLGKTTLFLEEIEVEEAANFDDIDVLFCALPHGLTQKVVVKSLTYGIRVIDLSADFRLSDPKAYEEWYNTPHEAKKTLEQAVYGMPELHREEIKDAQLIANPGCFPTSIILGIYPLIKGGYSPDTVIVVDGKTGVSGAGRGLIDANLYSQSNENINAYNIGKHRHKPEILEQLNNFSDKELNIIFSAHMIPITRGLLATIYVDNIGGLTQEEVHKLYNETYQGEPFIRVLESGVFAKTKAVSYSNNCDVSLTVDESTGKIIICSAIDNLIKGAAGQAMQNMNIMYGLDEKMGLEQMSPWP